MEEAAPAREKLLRVGETCWRIDRAGRVGIVIDAADYFATVRAAMMKARHSILLIGWDFDTRIKLDLTDTESGAPQRLGPFLNWIVKQRPELQIYVLKWSLGMLKALGRGTTPLFILDWLTDKRIHFRLDLAHPTSSAHHQKIVVIDDVLAFCGGIDMTADRWDTRDHYDRDPRRKRPTTGRRYGPWHDAAMAVDGAAARALGDMARERWLRATGERLAATEGAPHVWPERLVPNFTDVDVGVARTLPPYDGMKGVHEIEAFYLAAIAAARRTIYFESQYFASSRIVKAMVRRLEEPDGPDIVVLNPETADGWLEEKVMGASRVRMLRAIRAADHAGRFRMYVPVTEGRTPIYVHAKILVIDDWLLRIGSSNINNRSMGFDTECDACIEIGPEDAERRLQVAGLRDGLLAEHLGVEIADVEAAFAASEGRMIAAIESLRSDRRSLVPFDPPELSETVVETLADNELLDPERPASQRRRLARLFGWRTIKRQFT